MARNEAKIKFTAETRDLTAKLQSANSSLATLRAGLKLNEAQLKNTGDRTEYLKNKQTLLQTELDANAQAQEALSGKLEAAKRIYGDNSTEAERWSTKLTKAKTEQQELEAQLAQCTQELQDQAEEQQRAQTPLGQLNAKIADQKSQLEKLQTEYKNVALEQGTESSEAQELKGKIDALNSELNENEQKLKDVDSALEGAGEEAEKSANGGWSVLNQVVADLAGNAIQEGINKLKEFAEEAMKLGIDFSSSMSNVQAISGATTDEMAALETKARDLGATTKFSATDVSDAFGYMAMAGWKSSDMLAGIEGILNLAAASGEDLATTSDIVTDALTAFGLTAEDSGHFADVLAAASSNANTNVGMMGESFKYVAPVAGALGYSAEDVSLALGLMANSGIKASQGGTALRTMLTNMANPTDTMADAMERLGVSLDDGQGNMLSFREVMGQLREGFGQLKIPEEEAVEAIQKIEESFAAGEINESTYIQMVNDWADAAYGAEGALKAQAAAQLAGKTGLSGLMAIVNASEADYNKLADAVDSSSEVFVSTADGSVMTMSKALESGQEAIEQYSGSAAAMSAVMQNNLGGDLANMNSAMEELKLKIFDSVETPARNVVQLITGSVIPAATQVLQFVERHSAALGVLAGVIGIITTAMLLMNAVQAVKAAINATEAGTLGALISAKLASAAASWAALAPYALMVAAIVAVIAIIVLCVKHWDAIKAKVLEVASAVKNQAVAAWNALKARLTAITDGIRQGISRTWENIRTAVSNTANNLRTGVINVFSAIRSTAQSVWEGIKNAIINPIQNAYSTVTGKIAELRSGISSRISEIRSNVSETFESIKSAMTSPISTAKATIDGIINGIKGMFPLSIGNIFSNLKLPHITVSGGEAPFGIAGKGKLPSFGVQWYAKGAVFDAPTLIPTMNGIKGVGESGPEAVSPVSVLQSYIASAVQRYAPRIDYDVLAEKVAHACAKLNITINLDKRELGRAVREVM